MQSTTLEDLAREQAAMKKQREEILGIYENESNEPEDVNSRLADGRGQPAVEVVGGNDELGWES